MFGNRVVAASLKTTIKRHVQERGIHVSGAVNCWFHGYERIGSRKIVGHGLYGEPVYVDRVQIPYPAIRFKDDNTPELLALREKEKGDWKNLTLEEKKTLYRQSFCQTFAEFTHPRHEWKAWMGWTAWTFGISIFYYVWLWLYFLPPRPESFKEANQEKILKWKIDTYQEPISGFASKWDYENHTWKPNTNKWVDFVKLH